MVASVRLLVALVELSVGLRTAPSEAEVPGLQLTHLAPSGEVVGLQVEEMESCLAMGCPVEMELG